MSDLPTPEPVVQIPDQPLDIQHDPFPAEDHGIARRIPHLGHALLFFALATTVFFLCFLIAAAASHSKIQPGSSADAIASILLEGVSYILTLIAAWYLFPLLWKRSFLDGIHWNGLAARRYWARLASAGVILTVMAQLAAAVRPRTQAPLHRAPHEHPARRLDRDAHGHLSGSAL